jgi:hypothetical protein
MKQKILFPLFAVGLFLYSCSKDSGGSTNNNPNTDSVIASYSTSNTLLIDQLALYTKNGIVTDAVNIQNYLDRHVSNPDVKRLFYVNQRTVENPGISVTLDRMKSNRVVFKYENMEIVESNDTMMLIADYDSMEIPYRDASPCGRLLESVPAITPWNSCPSAACTRYRKTYPVMISDDNNYYLPTLYYAVSTSYLEVINDKEVIYNCTSVSQEYPMFNRWNPGLIDNLGERDTVLVQTGRLPLIKKSK